MGLRSRLSTAEIAVDQLRNVAKNRSGFRKIMAISVECVRVEIYSEGMASASTESMHRGICP
jgi:hypothetical protein